MQIGLDGVQLLGGHGFTKEHPVERWYRDLRAIGVAEASSSSERPGHTQGTCDDQSRTSQETQGFCESGPPGRCQIFRPVSRKYDLAEHEYPVELDTMAAMVEALNDSGQGAAARHSAAKVRPRSPMAKMPTAETWPDSSTSSKLAGVTSD